MKTKQKQSKMMLVMAGVILLLVALSISLTVAYFTAKTDSSAGNVVFGTLKTSSTNIGYNAIDGNAVTGRAVSSTITLDNLVPGDVLTLNGKVDILANIDVFVRYKTTIGVTIGSDVAAKIRAAAVATLLQSDPDATEAEQTAAGDDAVAAKAAEMEALVRSYIFTSDSTSRIAGGNTKWFDATGANTGATNVDEWLYFSEKVNKTMASEDYCTAGEGTAYTFTAVDLTGGSTGVSVTFPTTLDNYWQGATVAVAIDVQTIQAEHSGVSLPGTSDAADAQAIAASTVWGQVASNVLY